MTPIDPQTPISATLAAAEWNVVIAGLHEVPYRLAAPIIAQLSGQLQLAAAAVEPTQLMNGGAYADRDGD